MQRPFLIFQRAHFLTSAPTIKQCPADVGAEVAFAGRSNAGKSSTINTITNQKALARTSKTPGRTQLINFFSVDTPNTRLVDLPGYGFAKVPLQLKNEWQKNMAGYLRGRDSLKAVVLVMDIRHPLTEFDTMMCEWAHETGMPVHVVLTKADKLKRGPQQATLLDVRRQLKYMGDKVSVQVFSSLKRIGVEELSAVLTRHLRGEELTPAAEPAAVETNTPTEQNPD